jgi:hypothetical protein
VRIFEGIYPHVDVSEACTHEREEWCCMGLIGWLGIITGIKAKVENRGQYNQYLEELKPLREELGVSLKEDLYPEESK